MDKQTMQRLQALMIIRLAQINHIQRDVKIAAELLEEPVYLAPKSKYCHALYAWTTDFGRHSKQWYAGFERIVRLQHRIIGRRHCRRVRGECYIKVVDLMYVTSVLYGEDTLQDIPFSEAVRTPCYEDGYPIDLPPIDMPYEEYTEIWKL